MVCGCGARDEVASESQQLRADSKLTLASILVAFLKQVEVASDTFSSKYINCLIH